MLGARASVGAVAFVAAMLLADFRNGKHWS
jgi:hypothetical protein